MFSQIIINHLRVESGSWRMLGNASRGRESTTDNGGVMMVSNFSMRRLTVKISD